MASLVFLGRGVGGVIMTGLNRGECLGAFSSPLFSPSDMSPSHTASFHSFQRKYLPDAARPHVFCYKFIRLASPVQVFQKKYILGTAFVMTSIFDMKGILVDCGKIDHVC